ncbi:MAG: hypothetical protein WD380_01235 [Gaiellaceae bacterium]
MTPGRFPSTSRSPGATGSTSRVDRRLNELLRNLPDRTGRAEVVERLNSASRWYPRPVVWLLVGLVAVAIRRSRLLVAPLVLACAALLVLLGTAVAVYAVAQYSVPVAPAFILLAAAGVLGRSSAPAPRT